ncbi:MAG: betaine/proline/choline family ABC transporter ATP-binding protein [Actinomycetota bacterium]|nr:betaine/proline/choline family ABC transporter ATP-binding protein [Actinomycetota bacterium]
MTATAGTNGQGRDGGAPGEAMIRLETLSKQFPQQAEPAVRELSLEVPEGEIVILVGPSGCGKTTTMEMINRLVEPTSGRIFLEGEDVTATDPDQLRRRMGYVIQQIGLFPHRTIFDNIATVPRLLKWSDDKVHARVDELLELVGLEPSQYRDRYPKQLSGGQRQRIGVARAMGADPPVLLMDEPFGAVDPITRERLQNEFLRLQEEIRKTIVFVTHDIDEAIKMGDRIAILRVGSELAQYDTPEHILSNPADDFVADFLGSGVVLKRLQLARIGDVEPSTDWPTATGETPHDEARRLMDDAGSDWVLVLDDRRHPRRWVGRKHLDGGTRLAGAGVPVRGLVDPKVTLRDALQEMLISDTGVAVVVDDDAYVGTLDQAVLQEAIRDMRDEARAVQDQEARA